MGIRVKTSPTTKQATNIHKSERDLFLLLEKLGLDQYSAISDVEDESGCFHRLTLRGELANAWAPDFDTTQLTHKLGLDTINKPDDLQREILLAMLLSPVPFKFPSSAELASAVRIRNNVVLAARKTSLDFHTTRAERPDEYWTYHNDRGFTLIPGKSLITALQKATQPEISGQLYSFSCYRATEYVILLGVAQELASCNPALYQKLQRQWETKAIKSGKFHEVFLREYGSMEQPLPPKYYVPGDRLWFRNPDNRSSDVTGYEGSWVFYLGGGLFTNFWNHTAPYTLTSKCLEIYHWRNSTYLDQAGELKINEDSIKELVIDSLKNPAEMENILKRMLKLREPQGVYVNGGCIDTSREYPRCVCPGTSEISITAG